MKHPGVRGVNPVPVTRYDALVAGAQKYLLDWTGAIVTVGKSRLRELGRWAYWAVLWLLGIGFVFGVLGWPAAAVTAAAAALYTGRSIISMRVLEVAAHRWGEGDMEGARAYLRRVVAGRRHNVSARAGAAWYLARLERMDGNASAALAHDALAMKLCERSLAVDTALLYLLAAVNHIGDLVSLGKIAEARQELPRLPAAPRGEVTHLLRWSAELYVCLAEGAHTLSKDDLFQRSRAALASKLDLPALVALCAWASDVRGDAEMASHLLAEAVPLLDALPMDRLYPPLHAWMQQARGHLLPAGLQPG